LQRVFDRKHPSGTMGLDPFQLLPGGDDLYIRLLRKPDQCRCQWISYFTRFVSSSATACSENIGSETQRNQTAFFIVINPEP
jgi:hypothetical protein